MTVLLLEHFLAHWQETRNAIILAFKHLETQTEVEKQKQLT